MVALVYFEVELIFVNNVSLHKIKIGILLNCSPNEGGQFQYTLSMLNALNALPDNRFEIIALYDNQQWETYADAFLSVKMLKISFDTYYLRQIVPVLRCDLMICPSQGPSLDGTCLPVPMITVIHDLNYYYDREVFIHHSNASIEYRNHRYQRACNISVGIFVDSEFGKQQVIELFGKTCESKIFILPFTVPIYLEKKMRISDIELKNNLPSKFILYPAAIVRHKNHRNLILALKQLAESGLEVNLIFTGIETEYWEELRVTIQELGLSKQIKYLGYVSGESLCFLYRQARAMIMPTMVGPTNIPPLEGMYMGCPVAVSNIGAMPEQVGKNGLVFNPNNVDEIAAVIQHLWQDDELCDRLIQNGFQQMKIFSIEMFNKRVEEFIGKILDNISDNLILAAIKKQSESKKIICYGAGNIGYWVNKYLKYHNFTVEAFIDQKEDLTEFCGKPVLRVNQCVGICSEYILILTMSLSNAVNVMPKVAEMGFGAIYHVSEEELLAIYNFFRCAPSLLGI